MRTSDALSKIAPALLSAQKQITFAAKDATNPHFKSKYADLESVIDAVKKPLNDNGIMFIQSFSPSDTGKLNLTTRLIHESGEWIEDELTMPLQKNDAQGYGSAATYSRRYALAAITGLYQADDDGNEAVKPAPKVTLSDSQYTDILTAINEAENVKPIGEFLKSAVSKGATEKQLDALRTAATQRKQTILGAQA
jgi:hypothetical protein